MAVAVIFQERHLTQTSFLFISNDSLGWDIVPIFPLHSYHHISYGNKSLLSGIVKTGKLFEGKNRSSSHSRNSNTKINSKCIIEQNVLKKQHQQYVTTHLSLR